MREYLVFDNVDIVAHEFTELMASDTYKQSADNPTQAALIFADMWGERSWDYDENPYVFVIDWEIVKKISQKYDGLKAKRMALRVALKYRPYKTWNVDDEVDEWDMRELEAEFK